MALTDDEDLWIADDVLAAVAPTRNACLLVEVDEDTGFESRTWAALGGDAEPTVMAEHGPGLVTIEVLPAGVAEVVAERCGLGEGRADVEYLGFTVPRAAHEAMGDAIDEGVTGLAAEPLLAAGAPADAAVAFVEALVARRRAMAVQVARNGGQHPEGRRHRRRLHQRPVQVVAGGLGSVPERHQGPHPGVHSRPGGQHRRARARPRGIRRQEPGRPGPRRSSGSRPARRPVGRPRTIYTSKSNCASIERALKRAGLSASWWIADTRTRPTGHPARWPPSTPSSATDTTRGFPRSRGWTRSAADRPIGRSGGGSGGGDGDGGGGTKPKRKSKSDKPGDIRTAWRLPRGKGGKIIIDTDHLLGLARNLTGHLATMESVGEGPARKLAQALGIKGWHPGSYDTYNVKIGGWPFRTQILWAVKGHFDDIHIGMQRVHDPSGRWPGRGTATVDVVPCHRNRTGGTEGTSVEHQSCR